MKMRNTQMELAQFKSMMMQKDRQAQKDLQAQAAEFEREKAQAAAQAQTAAQAVERLAAAGVRAVVAGHQPHGDAPVVIRCPIRKAQPAGQPEARAPRDPAGHHRIDPRRPRAVRGCSRGVRRGRTD
jgi:hypothetical protein